MGETKAPAWLRATRFSDRGKAKRTKLSAAPQGRDHVGIAARDLRTTGSVVVDYNILVLPRDSALALARQLLAACGEAP